MIINFCRRIAHTLAQINIVHLDRLLEKPDPRTDRQKIKDDFEKALQKYKKEQHYPFCSFLIPNKRKVINHAN